MSYNLLMNGVYWSYNPLTNHLLTSWDIQVEGGYNCGCVGCVFLGSFSKRKKKLQDFGSRALLIDHATGKNPG